MPQSDTEKTDTPKTPMTVSEILDDYATRRHSLIFLRKRYILQPLLMHHVSFNCIRDYSMELLPQNRDVLFCFEHVKYDSMLNPKEVKSRQGAGSKPPPHCIVLMLKFIEMNTYLIVGTIGYMDFTDRAIVAECIKEYIEDCFRADLRVLASCSSGQLEVMTILAEMQIFGMKHGDLLMYSIRGRGSIAHIFDPCWLMRKLKTMFCTHDVIFNQDTARYVASHENIQMLLKYPRLQKLLDSVVYDFYARSTESAAKTFSRTVSILLEGFYKPFDPTSPIFPEAIGTKIFIQLFDQLFDSFNSVSSDFQENKPLRQPLTLTSAHWDLWQTFIPMLETMRFAHRTMALFPELPAEPKEARRNKLRKKHCKSAEPPALALMPNEYKMDAYDDDEYKSPDAGENDDELVKFLTTMLKSHKNAEDALPEYLQDASEKCRNAELLLSLARAEGLAKEIEKLRDRIDLYKVNTKLDKKEVLSVESLVNTIAVYNTELRVARRNSLTYEYLSCKLAGKLRLLTDGFTNTESGFIILQNGLVKLSNMLRFLNFSVFQSWISSIFGMRHLFAELKKHHCESFDTKIVNCDEIHNYLDIMRNANGLFKVNLAVETQYGAAQDYHVCILALTEEFNDSIMSSIFDGDDKQSKAGSTVAAAAKKKKPKTSKKHCGSNPQAENNNKEE